MDWTGAKLPMEIEESILNAEQLEPAAVAATAASASNVNMKQNRIDSCQLQQIGPIIPPVCSLNLPTQNDFKTMPGQRDFTNPTNGLPPQTSSTHSSMTFCDNFPAATSTQQLGQRQPVSSNKLITYGNFSISEQTLATLELNMLKKQLKGLPLETIKNFTKARKQLKSRIGAANSLAKKAIEQKHLKDMNTALQKELDDVRRELDHTKLQLKDTQLELNMLKQQIDYTI